MTTTKTTPRMMTVMPFGNYTMYSRVSDNQHRTLYHNLIKAIFHSTYIDSFIRHIYFFQEFSTFLLENEARVKDIELISGLQFLSEVPSSIATVLRTRLPVSHV